MKKIIAMLLMGVSSPLIMTDQTIDGDLYVGQGYHDTMGYSKRVSFLGNTDPAFISQFNTAPNETEFRFNIGDDLQAEDKFVVGVTNAADGQWYHRMVVQGDGNVGIGTNIPQSKLEVNGGDIKASGNLLISSGNATGGGIKLADDGDIVDLNDGFATHRFSYGLRITDGRWGGTPVIQLANGVNGGQTYFNAGNVGIGTTAPDAKLAVKGMIHTQEVRVDMNNWSDFVFKPDHKLMPLTAVERYVERNKHLPGIP